MNIYLSAICVYTLRVGVALREQFGPLFHPASALLSSPFLTIKQHIGSSLSILPGDPGQGEHLPV